MTAQAQTSLEDIAKRWAEKPINNVVNGSLGIMLERFDQTWPTWMGTAIRDAMEKGESKVVLDEETDLTVTIDSKNGYVEVGDAGTDGESMSACYWNRSNGHKLLAVHMSDPTDPFIELVCFYDYDPQKKALIPERIFWADSGNGRLRIPTTTFCRSRARRWLSRNGLLRAGVATSLSGTA
jgi:hypothetical protein